MKKQGKKRTGNGFQKKNRNTQTRSSFLGSRITAKNKNAFLKAQIEAFISNYEKQMEKNDENQTLTKERIMEMATKYARDMKNKENKHYRAWVNRRQTYQYKGQTFMVMTESFIKKSNSIIDIIQQDQTEEE